MENNIVLRQLRYIFDLSDENMIELFAQAEVKVTREEVSNWLKKEEHKEYQEISDSRFASFLNGFINDRRGKRDGPQPVPEKRLNNNIIFRKLRIALAYKDTDILDVYNLADMRISKHEVNAIFRKPSQSQYRVCEDQFLRNFLYGLQLKYRPDKEQERKKE